MKRIKKTKNFEKDHKQKQQKQNKRERKRMNFKFKKKTNKNWAFLPSEVNALENILNGYGMLGRESRNWKC